MRILRLKRLKEFKSVELENEYLREQVSSLSDSIAGVICEKGRLVTNFSTGTKKVEINDSSILSRLISEAGRWCNYFASDLFILWKYNVDRKFEDGTIEDDTLIFAFRENGVDSKSNYETKKEWPGYYRAVWQLRISVDGDVVEMRLSRK